MSNYAMKSENNILSNVAVLTMRQTDTYYSWGYASEACGRFLQSAELLPDKEFLGWQLSPADGGGWTNFVFSSPGVKAASEDFNWIFQECAKADAAEEMPEDIYRAQRTVYVLCCLPSSHESEENADGGGKSAYDNTPSRNYFKEMLEMMRETEGSMRIVSGADSAGRACEGMIFFSLPEEITLRMRALISLAFPGTAVKEFGEMKSPEAQAGGLPLECLRYGMTGILQALMDGPEGTEDVEGYVDDEKYVDDGEYPEIPPDESIAPDTLIDELDLSVRSYNCLKRAGICTVGELLEAEKEDFVKIRNLGRKSAEEIRHKLSQIKEIPMPARLTAPDYSAMLDELVGLREVKEQVRKITAFARMRRDISRKGMKSIPVVMNMEFIGNPGTAKTTVARILAGIFYESGLLSDEAVVEVGRADLVAKYVGQTADKVKAVFQKAKGKLLFIDEAYSLVENRKGDFGDEAINTIVQEMENNREDTIVIFAGYPDKMEEFFSRNQGLRSRVPFRIRFEDYSADEMVQIAECEARRRGFTIEPQTMRKVESICREAKKHPDMGNGRFCRNLIESAILGYASRVYGSGDEEAGGDFALREEDFVLPDTLSKKSKSPRPIGFAA